MIPGELQTEMSSMRNIRHAGASLFLGQVVSVQLLRKSLVDQCACAVKIILQFTEGMVIHRFLNDTMGPNISSFTLDQFESH